MSNRMNDHKGFKHSFIQRLTWSIMLVLFVVFVLFSSLIMRVTYHTLGHITERFFKEMVYGTKENIIRHFSDIRMGNINSLDKVRRNLHQPDSLYPIFKRVVSQNPNILGCGVAFEPDYYPQKGKWFEPYVARNKKGEIVCLQLAGPDYDYFQFDWYKQTIAKGENFWSDPYSDEDGLQTKVCGFSQPVKDENGRIVGAFIFNLSLRWLKDKLMKRDREENLGSVFIDESDENIFYSFIIDRHGTYIVPPEKYDSLDGHTAKLILEDHQQLVESRMNGEDVVMFHEKFLNPDWTIVLVVPSYFYYKVIHRLCIGLIVLIIICLAAVYFASRKAIKGIARPLVNFAEASKEIAKGNFYGTLPEVESKDEIGLLHDSFSNMQHSLIEYVKELKETTATNAAIKEELRIASNIQMSMMPKIFPPYPERNDIDIFGFLKPAKAVGGDLFDFFIRDEKLFFCIGDVSGKGIPASLFMTVAINFFNAISAHETKPDKILTQMNEIMFKHNDTCMFVTLFIGVLDLTTGHLNYCNGGHLPPLLFSDTDVTMLTLKPSNPVGVLSGIIFKGEETDIAPMSTIFLCTDGLTEAENAGRKLYGKERLIDVAQKAVAANQVKPHELIDHYLQSVHEYVGDAEQSDDLTMLAIRYKP